MSSCTIVPVLVPVVVPKAVPPGNLPCPLGCFYSSSQSLTSDLRTNRLRQGLVRRRPSIPLEFVEASKEEVMVRPLVPGRSDSSAKGSGTGTPERFL
ncbi:hypothetical protein FCM35_KLT02740 [Carex littledalei]|uniref:Uncharacterized protein n=1 Tax=Carex littledalei TaxID=544730 RepID=A0A833VQR4_9POAL|nr:hypothetical protein FCM35_KLT02740 [Carex littledalei]